MGVDPVTVEGLHAEIRRLVRRRGGVVLNVNAHCLNLCYEDPGLRRFFGAADLVFCDGAGVRLAAKILGGSLPERITYADWLPRLATFAESEGLSLFFLGARPGVAEKAARRLRSTRPGLEIVGIHHGFFDHAANSPENGAVVAEINAAGPDLLLLGLGMPLQERWLMENLENLNVGAALTGGAFLDYAAGNLRRGPRLLTDNGLEWLARLLVEPRRLWRRYLLGNPVFLARVVGQRLRMVDGSRKRQEM
ncbi:WecB/TagA/CpsF family glycosyltransferase [Rubrobacter tropicus]|uniref:WecB/TagA/CpsF family glycosyltransferase n=1 Tax=Rubrobacter tropicus TaxID=2653851 RepID=UPI00140C5DBA|nr:WecB/TagA/CpsF family glycosyltransferase [Rubrobacter tropicus]